MRRRRILTIPRSTGDTLQTAPAMSSLGTTERRSTAGSQCASLLGFDGFPVRDRSSRVLFERAPEAGAEEKRQDCRRWTALQPRAASPRAPCIHPAGKDSAIMVRAGAGRRFQPKPHGFQPYRRHLAPGRTLMKTLIPAAARVHGRGGPCAWLAKVVLATRMARSTG